MRVLSLSRIKSMGGILICPSRASSSSAYINHYEILGVKPTATLKEIKTAYYSLSKKHHPDTNPDRKDEAAKMFTQVAESYEILSSEDKRKAYDLTRRPMGTRRASSAHPVRGFTDLDIDYKNFEAFQKNARRRQQRRDQFVYEWPDEFSQGDRPFRRPREFRSVFDEATERVSAHKDSRTVQREMEELRREMEREQERIARRYPMPTFEEMKNAKRRKDMEEQRKYTAGLLSAMTIGAFLYLLIRT
ncbi:dnj-18 [Pristionchus pacificus]|uniref:J domain-containing protein n=1 Tax=Pristionchus pacificus TaxID=54126 RepID=A0A8R1UAT0_PRIPA|nr:dnj-18 [Pristionchus pacificus]